MFPGSINVFEVFEMWLRYIMVNDCKEKKPVLRMLVIWATQRTSLKCLIFFFIASYVRNNSENGYNFVLSATKFWVKFHFPTEG
jgi:hypothetical protein